MSKYTTELRYICETLAGQTESVGYDNVDDVITLALPHLFSFDFPIFDEEYRNVLERKIVKHYYTREICAETVGLWKLYLDRKLNEIMPFYNQLYRTELLNYDPLHDVDLERSHTRVGTESGERHTNGTYSENGTYDRAVQSTDEREYSGTSGNNTGSENTVTNNEDHLEAYSDTPNNKLTNVTELDYLTALTRNTSDDSSHNISSVVESANFNNVAERGYNENVHEQTTRSSTDADNEANTINTTENYIEKLSGSSGGMSYSRKIAEFRKNILNIDMMIIDELSDLFFGLW